MAIDYRVFKDCGGQPKPEPRKRTKARMKRRQHTHTADVRAYVFGRERNICRCCRLREAHSMHEIRFRSLGGKVSRHNSIAVCGSGTTLCHGFLQSLAIKVERTADDVGQMDADRTLRFQARTLAAAEHVRVRLWAWIESPVMLDVETAD